MTTTYRFKQSLWPKLLIVIFFGVAPAISREYELYRSIPYFLILLFLELMMVAYTASKRVTVTDTGLKVWILFFPWRDVSWENIEEGYVLSGKIRSRTWTEPFAGINWAADRSAAGSLKLIVKDDEALLLSLRKVRKGAEFYEIIQQRVKIRAY